MGELGLGGVAMVVFVARFMGGVSGHMLLGSGCRMGCSLTGQQGQDVREQRRDRIDGLDYRGG
jgi:hypothetical protein